MPTYRYKAKKAPADSISGLVEAESQSAAIEQLSAKGYYPTHIDVYADKAGWRRWQSISQKDLGFFTRQVADLLEAHVPLMRALELAEEQGERVAYRQLIKAIAERVRGGESFSGALSTFPRFFSPVYVSLVYAGEVGGMLPKTLDRLATFMEGERDLRSRIWAALAYPLFVAGVGGMTVFFLMIFVVPRLSAMFVDSGQGMPWIARGLTGASELLSSPGGIVALLVVTGLGVWGALRDPAVTRAWARKLFFKIPIWGQVLKKGMIARFTRTLAMLLTGGVPILEALRVVSQILEHAEFQDKIGSVIKDMEQGKGLSEGLKGTALFPSVVCQMIAIGEEGNTLEKALEKISSTYEIETDRAMKLATSLLEPVMILGVGSIIGVIVIGMLLPVFEISTFVK